MNQEAKNEQVHQANAEVMRPSEEKPMTLVDTIFDIGLAWAEFGVGQGKRALENSARTLEKVAQSLNDLEQRLRKDAV